MANILAFLFLALAVTPCSDGANREDLHADEMSAKHDHSKDSDDTCPITCICKCCGMSFTYQAVDTFEFKNYPKINTEFTATYKTFYRFNFLYNIWQPPRLIS